MTQQGLFQRGTPSGACSASGCAAARSNARLFRTVNIYNCLRAKPLLSLRKRLSAGQHPSKARSLFPPFYSPTSQIYELHRCGDQETLNSRVCVCVNPCVLTSVSNMKTRTLPSPPDLRSWAHHLCSQAALFPLPPPPCPALALTLFLSADVDADP